MVRGGEVWPAWRWGYSLTAVQAGLGVGARLSAGVAGARRSRALLLHRPPRPCRSSLSLVAATAVLAGDWFPSSVHRIMPQSDLTTQGCWNQSPIVD